MTKKISISNSGQFAGNIDSPGAIVNVGRQEQGEAAMAPYVDDPEVQAHLAADDAPEVKKGKIAARLAQLANVGLDVALTFAAKLVQQHTG